MKYYSRNCKEYIEKTKDINMQEAYAFFLKYVKPKSKLLDIGFGSGRDMLYFKSIGFNVYGIDPEPEFCFEAKKKGLNVDCCNINDYSNVANVYDCIWASASMHHIHKQLLNQSFKVCNKLLKENGIMFLSVKYGNFEGYDDLERYFLYQTEDSIATYLKDTKFIIIDNKITDDNLNRNIKWLNIILKKQQEGN